MAGAQARYWILTVAEGAEAFAFFPPEVENVGSPDSPNPWHAVVWTRGQQELGAGGLLHWQLVVGFPKPARLAAVRALFPGAHAEPTRSTAADDYVWKEDTRVAGTQFQLGAKPTRRNNPTDWQRVWDAAKVGDVDSIEPAILVRHYGSIQRIAADYLQPPAMERSVSVFWGDTGTGKTRRAWQEAGAEGYPKAPTTVWWCGYRRHAHVIIDEFCGNIGITHLLRWFDRYPVIVEVKGGSRALVATHLWVTSNIDPDRWYNDDNSTAEQRLALRRRFTHVIHFPRVPLFQ